MLYSTPAPRSRSSVHPDAAVEKSTLNIHYTLQNDNDGEVKEVKTRTKKDVKSIRQRCKVYSVICHLTFSQWVVRNSVMLLGLLKIKLFIVILLIVGHFYNTTSEITSKKRHTIHLLSPRIVYLNDEMQPVTLEQNTKTSGKLPQDEEFETDTCKAMFSWQKEYFPSCNVIHEINMNDPTFQYITHGGFRDVWTMKDWDGTTFVVKTLVQKKEHNYREFDRHRRDAIAMDQLRSSLHIPNIYSSCSSTGVFDHSPNGDIESQIVHAAKNGTAKTMWTSEEMLRYSWQVMAAIADLHHLVNKTSVPAIAHTDISSDQFLWMDGMFKLNDFNRARFIRWNVEKKEPCEFFIAKSPGKHRSPEEYAGKDQGLTEAVDVFSAGHVLYLILVKEDWNIKTEKAQNLIRKKKRPKIPDDIYKYANGMERAIIKAIKMCFIHDAKERRGARDIEQFLYRTMQRFNISEV